MKNVLLVVAAIAIASSAWASGKTGKTSRAAAKPAGDSTFVMKMAKGSMAEVELGKLAAQKASNEQVKKLGQRMVDDHGKAENELKQIAQTKNITWPTKMAAKDKALQERLSKLEGSAFDRAYTQAMLADHKKDVNAVRVESQTGKDPDVKTWAAKTLPTLEEHLKEAQDASKAVHPATSSGRAHASTSSRPSTPSAKKS